MKKQTTVILLCIIIAVLLAGLLCVFFYIRRNFLHDSLQSELELPNYLRNIVINGKEYQKTSFSILEGTTITGSDANATDTIPATRIAESDNPAHVLQTGIFCRNAEISLDSFIIGKYEVSAELYRDVIESGTSIRVESEPSYFKEPAEGEDARYMPVERISWYDAVYFCNVLSSLCGYDPVYTMLNTVIDEEVSSITAAAVSMDMSKNGFRIPTEAEWEYAARGGNSAGEDWGYTYAGSNAIGDVAWYCTDGNFNILTENGTYTRIGAPHEIGLKKPNSASLFDMTGNVQEWCWDLFDTFDTIISSRKKISFDNPTGIAENTTSMERVARGGSWYRVDGESTVNYRLPLSADSRNIGCGIRLVRRPYKAEKAQ